MHSQQAGVTQILPPCQATATQAHAFVLPPLSRQVEPHTVLKANGLSCFASFSVSNILKEKEQTFLNCKIQEGPRGTSHVLENGNKEPGLMAVQTDDRIII